LRMSVHVIAEYFKRFYVGYRPMNLRMPTSVDGQAFDYMLFPAREAPSRGSAAADDEEDDDEYDEAAESEAAMEDDECVEVGKPDMDVNMEPTRPVITDDVVPTTGEATHPPEPVPTTGAATLRNILFIFSDRDAASSHPGGKYSSFLCAKERKEHYLVKDRAYGYLCVLCGNSAMETGILRAKKCFPLPDLRPLDAKLEAASQSSKASSPGSPHPKPTEREVSMLEELASLQKQKALLEELLQLQELEDFEKALQQEEEELQQALRRSELQAEEDELNRKRSRPADDAVAPTTETPPAKAARPDDEAPPAIVEPARTKPVEAKVVPTTDFEVPPLAIVEPSQAEPVEAKVVPPVVSMGSAVCPDLLDTVPDEPLFDMPPPEAVSKGVSEELLGTCKRLEVPPVATGPEALQEEVVQPSSVSIRIAPESDAEEGEEELMEHDVLIDVNTEGKLEADKVPEGHEDTKPPSPSKATVFYDKHMPPCPIEVDHKPATPAEQRLAVSAPGNGRGRGRGGRGSKVPVTEGTGRGRSRGAGRGRGGRGRGSKVQATEDEEEKECESGAESGTASGGEIEPEPKAASKAGRPKKGGAKAAPKRASMPKSKAAPKDKAKDPAPEVKTRGPAKEPAPEVKTRGPAKKRKAEDPAPEVKVPSGPAKKGG
ncbi:unnamed protein product, partial [Symbiodinium microadriaticum]